MSKVLSVWEMVIPSSETTKEYLLKKFRSIAKHWAFQLEKGDLTGYEHYQCRISLHKKTTMSQVIKLMGIDKLHLIPTCNNQLKKSNLFDYVLKEQSRVDGPWTDKDPQTVEIPEQYDVELYPWQQELYDLVTGEIKNKKYRNVHLLYDAKGCIGKTTFALKLTCQGKAEYIPPMNDAKDIMRAVYDLPTNGLYIIDLTRSMKKDKLVGLYSAIEQIKNGFFYDDRYEFKRRIVKSPAVIVLTNELPDMNLLSSDRWKIHVVDNNKLIDYQPPSCRLDYSKINHDLDWDDFDGCP